MRVVKLLLVLTLVAACKGPSRAAPTRIENNSTYTSAGTTTTDGDIYEITYRDGGKLDRIVLSDDDGTVGGTLELYYDDQDRLSSIDGVDGSNAANTMEIDLEYNDDDTVRKITSIFRSNTGTDTSLVEYKWVDGRISERIKSSQGSTWRNSTRYTYDDSDRLEKRTSTSSDTSYTSTTTGDFTFIDDGLSEVHSTTTSSGVATPSITTYDFDYSDGRLSQARRLSDGSTSTYDVSYDGSDRVSEIAYRYTGTGTTDQSTTAYTYGKDSLEGIFTTPDVPFSEMFDLEGASQDMPIIMELSEIIDF